ncbi:hypothetical protein CDES_07615 [Corynebacterium deserti GIMN1.010]|uniref:Uncharacterized protein n=1 Tax=Corynebacterium deserti GIMN1.010 TaxID=931089 RepID=A0A0M4CY33_9CORY|nr:hypothetical protein [Corynebacterium deserti]ALC05932.1 hypothetical protein CDES_07615 [Corynebacterium deserti GIMN1.010]
MAGVLIQDGRRSGHLKWSIEAIQKGVADGVIINPFATPRVKIPRNPSAAEIVSEIHSIGGEVLFDPMTHAAMLSNSDRLDFYESWALWGANGRSLSNPIDRLEHIERVFKYQQTLNVPLLSPTTTIDDPQSVHANTALDMARLAKNLDSSSWQSLVGTRAFWSSGNRLDAYIGTLVSLQAPVWLITVSNEIVNENVHDLSATDAFAGLYRTVHSLSMRSRVIVAYADFGGLGTIAAGADSVGSGWDRGQRIFDPLSFQNGDGTPRRAASYVTQGRLLSVLRRDAADAIEKWDPMVAPLIRGGAMPKSDGEERLHHLHQLRKTIQDITVTPHRKDRVEILRGKYNQAKVDYETLIPSLRPSVETAHLTKWITNPLDVLERYAESEGF